jgi:hypothetical protein
VDGSRVGEVVMTPSANAPWCRSASRCSVTMASVMIDEIRLRAHARPLDSDDQ